MAIVLRERMGYAFMSMTISDNFVGLSWKKPDAYKTKIKK